MADLGITLSREDVMEFDYERCGVPKEIVDEALHTFHTRALHRVRPIPFAVDVIAEFRDRITFDVVTSRPRSARADTLEWLSAHSIGYGRLVVCRDKAGIASEFDAFVEDNRETAYTIAAQGVRCVIMDHPWNRQNQDESDLITRVRDWQELRAVFAEWTASA